MKKLSRSTRIVRRNSRRRGASLVEFSLCFPVLMGVIFGSFEFSRVVQLQHSVRLAAFEGARAGVVLDAATSDVQTAVNTILNADSITSSTVTISSLSYTSPTVSVTVTVDPTKNAWINWYETSTTPVTATVTLNREIQSISVP